MKLKLCTALFAAAALSLVPSLSAQAARPAADRGAALERFGALPLSFEPTASSSRFLAHSGRNSVLVDPQGASVVVSAEGRKHTLRMSFEGANASAPMTALEPQPGVTNYFLGNDPARWRRGVRNYARVRAAQVYPGVDLVYYGDHRHLEFDFNVAPGADASAVALSFTGMDRLRRDDSGDLVAELAGEQVRVARPFAYQTVDGARRPVAAEFELASSSRVHLRLGAYDRSRELVIDPVVSYAVLQGGSQKDVVNGIAVDASGYAYVTGETCSNDFPDPAGDALNPQYEPSCDAFVTKYSTDGRSYEFTTLLGGTTPSNASAIGNGIALSADYSTIYIAGSTNYTNLPHQVAYANGKNSYQGGDSDAFIALLSNVAIPAQSVNAGDVLRLTYLGGSNSDSAYGVAADSSGNVIAVGQTCSSNFPAYNSFQTKVEQCVAFITKLDSLLHIGTPAGYLPSAMSPSSGSPYFFSGFYGGQPVPPYATIDTWVGNTAYAQYAIYVDPANNVQVKQDAGTTGSSTPSWAAQKGAKTTDGSTVWVNYGSFGTATAAATEAYGVALDPLGDIFVAGGTSSSALSPSFYAGSGAWVLKVSKTGVWVYSTVLETNSTDKSATVDTARAIAVDSEGRAFITGTTSGTLYTSSGAYKSSPIGGQDAFLVRMNNAGSAFDYATYLGGTGNDQGLGVAVDLSGAVYVTGSTQSTNFPTINPLTDPNSTPQPNASMTTLSGTRDAFITKFSADGSALIFSAYLGGSDQDQGNAIAVDPNNQGNMYVGGITYSSDLYALDPVGFTAAQLSNKGSGDSFVAEVAGSSLPAITVTPGALDFADQDVNTSSSAIRVQYTNTTGSSTVHITGITFSNPDFKQVSTASGDCSTGAVAPASACNIAVVFTPSVQGQRSGTLTISDDASSVAHVVNLSGQGAVPYDVFSGTSLSFGTAQGVSTTSSAKTLSLQNTGDGTLYVSSIAVTGDFAESDTCTPQVAASATCSVQVTFTPTAVGVRSGTLTITDNAPGSPHSFNLSGTGTLVTSTISASSLSFSQQQIGVASTATPVTLKNTDTSGQSLVVNTPAITGDYQVGTNTCTGLIADGVSCTINVVFLPTVAGTRTGTLTVSGNGSVLPASVTLTGTAGATSTLTPSTLTMTPTNLGATSAAQAVILTNLSSFPFNVTSIKLSGAAASDFAEVDDCGTSVSSGGFCTIHVRFTPSATGNRNATLTVVSDSVASPQTVSIVGVGTAPLVSLSPASQVSFGNQPLSAASTAQPITLSNTGSGPLNISTIVISGAASADFTQTNTCGTQVAAGSGCVISVTFTPSSLYSRSATLTITDDATPTTQALSLIGTGVQVAVPTFTPTNASAITFSNQAVGTTSSAQTITVKNNDSNYALTLTTPIVSGDFSVVASSTTCGTTLAAGATCNVGVGFTPTASGTRTGTLSIASNATSAPVVFQLSGLGGAVAAVSPTSLTLPSTNLGATSAARSVTLTNQSAFAVNITGVTITGTSASQFSYTNNCGTVVPALSACSISVYFTPSATGTQTAAMNIASDAAAAFSAVSLSGTGTSPVVSLSPTSLSFPDQALNYSSTALSVLVSNTGTGPLNISNIVISGAAATDFAQTNNCGTQVAANSSCLISVIFTPSALNSRAATLSISDDASSSPQAVTMSGKGVSGLGTIALSPTTLAFGTQQVNTTSPAKSFILTNSSSTSALAVTGITLGGSNVADFTLNSSACPASLSVGASCTITVTFSPSTTGARSAVVSIAGSASNSPQTLSLTGTGSSQSTGSADYTLTPDSTGVSVTQGSTAMYSISVTPLNNMTDPIQFTCTAPTGASCSLTPAKLTMDGTTVNTVKLYVNTSGTSARLEPAALKLRGIFFALLPFSLMGVVLVGRRRRGYGVALLLVVILLVMGAASCGASSGSSTSSSGLAPGTYSVSLSAASTGTTPVSHSLTFSLVVNKQ